MKSKAIALLVVIVGLAVGMANAQSTEPLTFRTPFAFVVGDRLVPAGEYTVRVVAQPGKLSFRSADGNVNVFITSLPIQKPGAADKYKLVFHRYGGHYYVSEIWTPGYETGRIMLQHPSELMLAKNREPQHVTMYLGR
ncbi:MAG: hypothetical protein LAO22_13580 [Acidobacteriia bacterium]|nr:hypothetical protein [Terriglobia bacterium]